MGIHDYKTLNIEFGFGPTDRVTTLECKRCGYTTIKGGKWKILVMKSIERNIDIRRYLNWSRIVKGKPIHIRLYELIYYELLIMWFEMNKPPLRRLIYETINSQDFEENFVRGKIFQKYIDEVLETPCEDGSGYYNPDSREILTEVNIKELYDIKFLIKDELDNVKMIDRYNGIFTFCKIYEKWCLEKKAKQVEDITKKERFDVTSDLPLKISEKP